MRFCGRAGCLFAMLCVSCASVGCQSRQSSEDNALIMLNGGYVLSNMAFSLWVVSGLPEAKEKITHEIMIGNVNHGGTPAGIRQGTLKIDGVTYEVYVRGSHGDASGQNANTWTSIAFTARTPVLTGPLRISPFLDYLIGKGILTRDLYVTSVELGNEIIEGTGKAVIRGYSIVRD